MIHKNRSSPPQKPLHSMFTAIPSHYDLINTIITWGMDKLWRRRAAQECLKNKPSTILDLCCGTGDLAISIGSLAKYNVELTGVDYSEPMLEIARKKARSLDGGEKISFIQGNAANLPFPDDNFDCVGISFAFRNLTYKNPLSQLHLSEVLRVLKNNGKYIILETSQPNSKLIRYIYHLYLHWFVFILGYLISGNIHAYRYLTESAARFYNSTEIKDILIKTGFHMVSFQPLFLGVAGLHVAIK